MNCSSTISCRQILLFVSTYIRLRPGTTRTLKQKLGNRKAATHISVQITKLVCVTTTQCKISSKEISVTVQSSTQAANQTPANICSPSCPDWTSRRRPK